MLECTINYHSDKIMSHHIDELLLPHRNAIDTIDAEILRLLNERAQHAHAIGELKGTGAVYRPECAVFRI